MTPAIAHDPVELTRQALTRVTALANLPETTARIIATVEDPRSSAAQLHKIVSHDPALVTRVLKVVNSAFYGLPGQIASIERAIVMLGLNAIKNIAVAASLGQLFRGTTLCDGYTARDLWSHCLAVAIGSRELAKRQKLPIADEAFLGGMIHDVGLLLALQVWPEQVRAACEHAKTSSQPFMEIETEHVGVDHCTLGAALADKWQFPKTCQLVAGHHHKPAQLAEASRQIVAVVHVADTLACHGELGFPLTAAHQSLNEPALREMGIDPVVVASLKDELPELVKSASAFLN